ncbi:MAG TPA: PhoU domain-containing protein [Acidimicrobiales bacterium]|nr:PhoU domain-containing protein [Acidimicrobiales bacterium]
MTDRSDGHAAIDLKVIQLFALVSEALSRATHALLSGDAVLGQTVIDGDQAVDALTAEVELLIWEELQERPVQGNELRYLVGLLLIIPELERSADLAEHVAQRAVEHLGTSMSPRSRGIVQLMTEVASEMWGQAADAFGEGNRVADHLASADEEMDILHARLTLEVGAEEMPASIAAQVTLLARFYERLGDHAVNLARRIELLVDTRNS